MASYGYCRVSGGDQNLARQTDALQSYGISPEHIFAAKQSGKDFERAEYKKLLSVLKEGDLVAVLSLDRLGRNYEQILAEREHITGNIKADIIVLDMPLLDARARADTLVGKFIADVELQVLSFVAENERSNIRSRQSEGIRLAKERGSFLFTDAACLRAGSGAYRRACPCGGALLRPSFQSPAPAGGKTPRL